MYTFVQQRGGGSRRDPNHKSMYKCAYMYVHLSLSPPPPVTSNIEGQSEKTLKQIAVKLHQHFAHASSKRLIRLLKDGGVKDNDFFECVNEVVKTCEICQRFARPPPRPLEDSTST